MKPVEITFRDDFPYENPAREEILKKAGELEKFHDRILKCRVVVEAPHKKQQSGNLYNVKIELHMPNKDIVVSNEHPARKSREDIFVAIRDAFDAARRRLEDHARRERGKVKAHELPPHGKIIRLFTDEGYGFIETPDGKEVYFNKNSVLDDKFSHLRLGSDVTFSEEPGLEGPQASTVRIVGKHHYA